MTINWQVWKKPEIGGVLTLLFLLTVFCLCLFVKTLVSFETVQTRITDTSDKTKLLITHIKAAEDYEKLQHHEAQKYTTFKKKKWDQLLTQDSLNNLLHDLQKQAKVEFLFIQPKQIGTAGRFEITLSIKVLRDQSFFNFLQKLESELPGIVSVKHFELKRIRELNTQLAKKVSQGEKVSLFEGKIDLEIEHAQIAKHN